MIILLLVLCLTAGAYMLIQRIGQEIASVNQTEGTFELTTHTTEDLRGLTYTKNEVKYHFTTLGDGEWQVSGNSFFPLDSDAVQRMAKDLISMTATRELTDVTAFADYGLEEPTASATITWADGTETTYVMGNATPFADGYYLCLADVPSTVYTVPDALTSILNKDLNALTDMEEIPQAENVTRIVVGNTLDAVYQEESSTIDPDQHWYDTSGTPLDGSETENLIETMNGLTFSSVADSAPAKEQLQEYHLDEAQAIRIVLYSGETAARTILIGIADANGDYYAKRPDSSIVYTMDPSDIDSLLNVSAASLAVTDPVPLTYGNLASVVFDGDGIHWTLQPVIPEETTADTEAEKVEAEDPGESIWEQIRGFTYSELSDPKEGEVLLTVSLSSTNRITETLTFSTYDVDHYQIRVDDQEPLLVSADQVDKLIRTLKSMQ